MSVVLRVREYRSIAEARKDLVSFQLPNLPPAVLLYGTVIMAEGKVSELLPLSYEARDLDGKAYSGRRGGRDALLIVLPHIDALSGPLPERDSILTRCINLYSFGGNIDVPLPRGRLSADRTLVMGILNVTPDSFSDGGRYPDVEAAFARAERMVQEGADIIDVGGESTRPGWQPISAEEELSRIIPVVRRIASSLDVPVSVDTMKPEVARAAMEAGASIINDVNGLRNEGMLSAVKETGAAAVVMHMRGTPQDMHAEVDASAYFDVISDVMWYLNGRIEAAKAAGIPSERLIVDPGLGFGKSFEHNIELLRRCREVRCLGAPMLIGASRKRFIGQLTERLPEQRLGGSVGAAVMAAVNGASIVRVHDVDATVQALRVADALLRGHNT
ncbi:MAG TPA: dihydropteroate synthase [Methanomassiliicoccaceae archaeon]|nr:dihydropteroate synthase [Methanomassiliicoccaceae archaeon]HOK27612.1 dihydropteroate synthase [Methanomassiliicoccaceae archaeon]HOQ25737.1 dihydropteroate synthase [Methanomassiliicoccaceae archaeon]HQA20510.1 dihydropteroate synthase [Methanomassiliicoccaceae archaeon]HQD88653.1 dihydropteroate synthase [Methanomassiliicoccaceae archaeon]